MIAGLLKDRNDYCHRLSMLERLSASCVCTKPAHVQAEEAAAAVGPRGTIPAGSGAVAGQTSPSKVTVAVAQLKYLRHFLPQIVIGCCYLPTSECPFSDILRSERLRHFKFVQLQDFARSEESGRGGRTVSETTPLIGIAVSFIGIRFFFLIFFSFLFSLAREVLHSLSPLGQ
jgi:hypothetical protein